MDATLASGPIVLACALEVEERAARKGGANAVRVGLGASGPVPPGRLVSFGLAGALVPEISEGTVVTATRVVGEDGSVLWEGDAVPVGREEGQCARLGGGYAGRPGFLHTLA